LFYLNNPKATAEVLTPDGWLKSGDIGYFDQDLNLFIVERIKEMMKTKYGTTIYPSEIESVLSSHPEVLESCVIGLPDEGHEQPTGIVVVKEFSTVDEAELHALVKDKLAPYKELTGGIRFVKEIPKLPSGKNSRKLTQEQIINRTL